MDLFKNILDNFFEKKTNSLMKRGKAKSIKQAFKSSF